MIWNVIIENCQFVQIVNSDMNNISLIWELIIYTKPLLIITKFN